MSRPCGELRLSLSLDPLRDSGMIGANASYSVHVYSRNPFAFDRRTANVCPDLQARHPQSSCHLMLRIGADGVPGPDPSTQFVPRIQVESLWTLPHARSVLPLTRTKHLNAIYILQDQCKPSERENKQMATKKAPVKKKAPAKKAAKKK